MAAAYPAGFLGWSLLLLAAVGCTNAVPQSAPPPAQRGAASGTQHADLDALLADARLVDLTHPFDETTIYWPTGEGFKLERLAAGVTDKGYYYAANRFTAEEHGGTHLDAPIHFYEGHATADHVALRRLVGRCAVVDVRAKCAAAPDYRVQLTDLREWEETQRATLGDCIVLLYTGQSRFWLDRARYLGTAEKGEQAVSKLHFPGLDPDAARWLADQRQIRAVGIDTASIDYGQSTQFESHVVLCEREIPIFENVAHLDELPAEGAAIVALPMKIGGGSGGPLRIIAILPPQTGD